MNWSRDDAVLPDGWHIAALELWTILIPFASLCMGRTDSRGFRRAWLELYKQSENPAILSFTEIREPARDDHGWIAVIPSRGRYTSGATKIWDVRCPMSKLDTKCYKLTWHVVKGALSVPGLKRVARILREIRGACRSRRAIDWRQQDQIASRVFYGSATQSSRESIAMKPPPVVKHEAQEVLRRTVFSSSASYARAAFATVIPRERKCHSVQWSMKVLVILPLNTVIFVVARPVQTHRVLPKSIGVKDEFQIARGPPEDLPTNSWSTVEFTVRLPTIDEPRFDLEFIGGKPLNPRPVKVPWCIRRNIRWLITPVIKVIVAKQTNVRQKEPRLNVDTMLHVHVVSTPGFSDVAVSVGEIPLAYGRTGVVPRCRGRIDPELCQHTPLHIACVKVAANPEVLHLDFPGTCTFCSAAEAVVYGVVVVVDVTCVGSEFTREVF